MDVPGTSSNFLESLLDQMNRDLPLPLMDSDETDPNQESDLLALPDNLLERILSSIPLKERILSVGSTCRRLREAVKKSITSIEFYKEELDGLKENALKYFLNVYGGNISHMNFDLFRSSFIEQCSQWNWRQSVVSSVTMCRNLRQLTVLVCNRHRLRDTDLITIFRQAPHLRAISVDAQFINGHCFQNVPSKLKKLELEMCYRITDQAMKYIFQLKNLKTLHMSQLLILKDATIFGIVSQLQKLEDLSIISHQDSYYRELSGTGLAMLSKLRNLRHLALEGLSAVTDRFLQEFAEPRNPVAQSLRSLSLAFCYNFSGLGLQRLSLLNNLEDLNLEGCSKRDISLGLEAIASRHRLIRLLVAENCRISAASLIRVLYHSPNLRLLDVTSNPDAFTWESANILVSNWAQTGVHPLAVLTDQHSPWNLIPCPPLNSRRVAPVRVIHVLPAIIPLNEFLPGSVLSGECLSQLPPGILSPRLRRGNRYRMLFSAMGPCKEVDEKENTSPFKRNSESPEQTGSPLFLNIPNEFGSAPNIVPPVVSNGPQPLGNVLNSRPPKAGLSPPNVMPKEPLMALNLGPLSPSPAVHNGAPFSLPPLNIPPLIPSPGNPEISLEMLTMLMGLEDLPFPSVLPEAPVPSRRSGGGAPRPPVEIPEQPKIHYTRGPRSKRRSLGAKKPTQPEANFNIDDFPPLGAN